MCRIRVSVFFSLFVPGFLVLFTAAAAYALTRLATYANSRYVLPVIALVYLLFFASLVGLVRRTPVRRAILGAFAVLLLVSGVRTVDPVSRVLYGTFPVGQREMLRVTSITRECCGAGRDQLVYNLEFTTLEALTGDALSGLAAGDSTVIVIPDSTDWFVATRVDRETHRRTVQRADAETPLVMESDSVRQADSVLTRAYFLALPNAGAGRELAGLAARYIVGAERRYRRGPYALSVYGLIPRAGTAAGRGDPAP